MRQLRYYVKIVESGSIMRASREVHIAQPALSQQIAKLEEEMGVPLLKRSPRGVVPTDHGRALYDQARFLLRHFDQVPDITRRAQTGVRGKVSVGLAPTTLTAIGLPLVKHMRERQPGIVLNVVEGLSGHLEQLARLGRLDLAVLFSPHEGVHMRFEPLLEEELVLIVSRESRLVPAGRKSITLARAAALPLIVPTGSHGLRRRLDIEFGRIEAPVNVVAEIDSLQLTMATVREGLAAAIQPMAATLAGGASHRDWRVLSISDMRLVRHSFLCSLPEDRLTTAAATVREHLREVVGNLVTAGHWRGTRLLPEGRGRP